MECAGVLRSGRHPFAGIRRCSLRPYDVDAMIDIAKSDLIGALRRLEADDGGGVKTFV